MQAQRLATMRTLSAQQIALTDRLDYHLPARVCHVSRWWRSHPRHAIQFVLCALVACLIQPTLATLTVTATLLVVLSFRLLDRLRRTNLPAAASVLCSIVKRGLELSVFKGHCSSRFITERRSRIGSRSSWPTIAKTPCAVYASSTWKNPMLLVVGIGLPVFVCDCRASIAERNELFGPCGVVVFTLLGCGGRQRRTLVAPRPTCSRSSPPPRIWSSFCLAGPRVRKPKKTEAHPGGIKN